MENNLVIVESPAKAKTIEKYLGSGYKVRSSYGHIRDLAEKDMGVDIDHGFKPVYEIPADKAKVVAELKTLAKQADKVWLASDEDREGEAIAWHLAEVLRLDPTKTKRIVFHEITKSAIHKAIENPRHIDINLVDAQQARRVLDRIVGFELSPVLWRKVKPALSAGRVQSVAVRLIVEREREIQSFVSESGYRVTAVFQVPDAGGNLTDMKAELSQRFKTKEEAHTFLQQCDRAAFTIQDINTKPLKKTPAPPFTTSTLQQEASRKLGFAVAQTMMVAQRLYEGGLISYMRTDSVNLSEEAIQGCRNTILSTMGDQYAKTRRYATKTKGAQEAHEAIRPTVMDHEEIEGTAQEKKLYNLIWKRTIASQMADAEVERTTATISISGNSEVFMAVGEVIKFDGFLRVYRESYDDDGDQEDDSRLLPPLTTGQQLSYSVIEAVERFTQSPYRYSEASLVRKMEELGIGRPSTYAPTISTIQKREYVEKGTKDGASRAYTVLTMKEGTVKESVKAEMTGGDKGKLVPTDIGNVVNDFLTQHFPNIMDYNFTANIEKQLDEVADGEKDWKDIMQAFYVKFHPNVVTTLATKTEHKVGERLLGNEPASGKPVFVKIGRFGPMVQIGATDDSDKPRFAQLDKGLSMDTITLDEALKLFLLPRSLGEFEGKVVNVGKGRFGPYVQHAGQYTSLPKGVDPLTVTLDEAIALIEDKRKADAAKILKTFAADPELVVLDGRYGPYISYQKNNYKLPKTVVPAALEYEEAMALVKQQQEANAEGGGTTKKRFARKGKK